MKTDTKEKIFQTSKKLWFEKGYENTTMRDIAAASGIAIGNLTYHFHRKDDILMVYHDRILNAADQAAAAYKDTYAGKNIWMAVEYAFLRYIADRPAISDLYRQVINSSTLRELYIDSHDSLYHEWIVDGNTKKASAAVSSLAFGMMQMHYLNDDFDGTMKQLYKVHYDFLDKPTYSLEDIPTGMELGRKLLRQMPDDL